MAGSKMLDELKDERLKLQDDFKSADRLFEVTEKIQKLECLLRDVEASFE